MYFYLVLFNEIGACFFKHSKISDYDLVAQADVNNFPLILMQRRAMQRVGRKTSETKESAQIHRSTSAASQKEETSQTYPHI